MGRQTGDQSQLFYLFNLEKRIPARHLLRRINPIVTRVLADLREKLKPFYSETIASSACVFGVSPAPATSSTLRPSCKILRHSQTTSGGHRRTSKLPRVSHKRGAANLSASA